MTTALTTRTAPDRSALAGRLRAAAVVLLGESFDATVAAGARDASTLLDVLVREVHARPSADRLWLLYTAIATVFPDADELRLAVRRFELLDVDAATRWLLATCLNQARWYGSPDADVRIVTDTVVVEVDTSARHTIHTGIQRVVRSTLPLWHREHDIVPVAWTRDRGLLRSLRPPEADRILRWVGPAANGDPDHDDGPSTLIVPWRCTVVLAEVPGRDVCARLAALAEFSGNRVVAIGYDCIPVVSADLVPPVEPARFVQYLSVLKQVEVVAAISAGARAEFAGFGSMLAAQGLAGPDVIECVLPDEVLVSPAQTALSEPPSTELPTILCVGRFEARKNQEAVLFAAERLWREGLDFRLEFIAGGSHASDLVRAANRTARRGRSISVVSGIGEDELDAAYRRARFTMFVSIHEGYGLPVAESLGRGTPVITTDYGSTAEIASAGGALTVDPRDDDAICAAMRLLLVDDAELARLVAEIHQRPSRSWADYAAALWTVLVDSGASVRAAHAGG